MLFEIGAFKNFAIFTRKTPVLESLFNKVADLEAYNFTKKRLQRRCFPVNIAKFSRTSHFTEHLRWLLLDFSKHVARSMISGITTVNVQWESR